MFRLPCIGFLRLVYFVTRMEAWAEQFLFSLTSSTPHGLDGIHRGDLFFPTLSSLHLTPTYPMVNGQLSMVNEFEAQRAENPGA